jgi:hypothetical protein
VVFFVIWVIGVQGYCRLLVDKLLLFFFINNFFETLSKFTHIFLIFIIVPAGLLNQVILKFQWWPFLRNFQKILFYFRRLLCLMLSITLILILMVRIIKIFYLILNLLFIDGTRRKNIRVLFRNHFTFFLLLLIFFFFWRRLQSWLKCVDWCYYAINLINSSWELYLMDLLLYVLHPIE